MSVSTPDGIATHPAENEYFNDFSEDLLEKDRMPIDEMPTGTFSSSNVHSALYDYGKREMFVRYLRDVGTDAVYQYVDVPASIWQGLTGADSKGSFINSRVAYEFRYSKVGRDELADVAEQSLSQGVVRRFVTMP